MISLRFTFSLSRFRLAEGRNMPYREQVVDHFTNPRNMEVSRRTSLAWARNHRGAGGRRRDETVDYY
jgi:hypothetical protein